MIRYGIAVVLAVVTVACPALAQREAQPDTVRLVRVGDSLRVFTDTTTFFHPGAVVVGSRAARNRSASTVQRIGLSSIERTDATNVADVARLIPSAHLQTNSRGETLLYLRNSGERQLAVYFDGALLNVPWDNRVDLDLVPASALGGISVSKGSVSSEFGTNLMGGAVNLISRDLAGPGRFTEAAFHLGSGSERQFDATHIGRSSSFSYLASVGYVQRDGLTLPSSVDLPYSQSDSNLRTNTDLKRINALARGEYTLASDLAVSIAALVIDAEKGIAPEGHKDPADGGVRYWRYPDWTNRMFIASVGRPSDGNRPVSYQTSVWMNHFEQRIVAYASDAFETVEEEEDDDDMTVGTRLLVGGDFDDFGIRFSAGGSQSRHDQVDTRYTQGPVVQAEEGPKQHFTQLLVNAGLEADYRSGAATYSAGVNLDSRSVLEADIFAEPDAQAEIGFRAGVIYELTGPFEIRASAGRRSRFPTLREQFSGALGRFVLNPDLGSEEAWLTESSVTYQRDGLTLVATGFLTLTSNVIDQTVVIEDGESKRMRVNLDGSRNVGLELNGSYRPTQQLLVTADATVSRLRAEEAGSGEYDRPLTERPESSGAVRISYTHGSGVSATLETLYTGPAYSLDEDGGLVDLASSAVINMRAAYRLIFTRQTSAELFARINNASDAVVENQLGLPGPGRTAIVGLKLSM